MGRNWNQDKDVADCTGKVGRSMFSCSFRCSQDIPGSHRYWGKYWTRPRGSYTKPTVDSFPHRDAPCLRHADLSPFTMPRSTWLLAPNHVQRVLLRNYEMKIQSSRTRITSYGYLSILATLHPVRVLLDNSWRRRQGSIYWVCSFHTYIQVIRHSCWQSQ